MIKNWKRGIEFEWEFIHIQIWLVVFCGFDDQTDRKASRDGVGVGKGQKTSLDPNNCHKDLLKPFFKDHRSVTR